MAFDFSTVPLEDKRVKEGWKSHFDSVAAETDRPAWTRGYYRARVADLVCSLVPRGSRVLELGSRHGDLLAALKPSVGVGIDQSEKMVRQAKLKHPGLQFLVQDAEYLNSAQLPGPFDYVVLSDLVGSLTDVWRCFRNLRGIVNSDTRVVVTYYNYLWEPILVVAEWLGIKRRQPKQNWLPLKEVENLLSLAGFETIRRGTATLIPFYIPLVSRLVNRYLAPLPIFYHFCLSLYVVARPMEETKEQPYSVTVAIPCRNEAGNIDSLVERTPDMGSGTEIIFIDGNSNDGTVDKIEENIRRYQGKKQIRLVHQGDGRGKADAVHKGFAVAKNDILMILDADATVLPEELPKFYLAMAQNKGEFINGSRLAYPTDDKAFRPLNLLGNKFFSLLVSWLMGQRVGDTLCGTKVFFRKDYARIMSVRDKIGKCDPFGDFEFLFGAAYANLRIVQLPVRYHERTYGQTKISRFRDGWRLMLMCITAARRLKMATFP